jgi:putative endonuclease
MKRIYEHKHEIVEGFTCKYHVHLLVYYEVHESIGEAIVREKQLKKWNREWKLNLVNLSNPNWKDLCTKISE